MQMVVHAIWANTLKIGLVENVGGILKNWAGEVSFMQRVLSTVKSECPQFAWSVDVLEAEDYLLPQMRRRVFLRGIRTSDTVDPA